MGVVPAPLTDKAPAFHKLQNHTSGKSSGRPWRRTIGQPRGNSGKPSGASGGGSSPPPTLFTVEVYFISSINTTHMPPTDLDIFMNIN